MNKGVRTEATMSRAVLLALALTLLLLGQWRGLARAQDDEPRRLPEVEEVFPAGEEPGPPMDQPAETIPAPQTGSAFPAPGDWVPAPHDDLNDHRGSFPALPPDPYETAEDWLPPLDEELFHHGGAQLYAPEGDRWNWPDECESHYDLLRLPECWEKPHPIEGHVEFLGPGPIDADPSLQLPHGGYHLEPRFVGYGSYQLFGLAFEEGNRRQHGIGHHLLVELDLRLTGTERFHMQFRPLGRRNTGGSFYQFSDPSGYVNNATAEPDRYWFEGEFASIFGGKIDPFFPGDVHFVLGRYPFALHNNLLMNTDLLGAVINKNTIYLGTLSNLNVQLFAAREDVAAFAAANGYVYGTHITADHRHAFYEATFAFLQHESNSTRNAQFVAISRTQLYGPWVVAARAMAKFGDQGGTRDGQLFVLETNRTQYFNHHPFGLKYGVWYCNAFVATDGWNPISGGGFDRLRTSFEVNPLVSISAGNPVADNWGVSLGVQLFRNHEDESLVPEIAVQSPMDQTVFGCGLRYQRKTSSRSFLEVLGILNFSDDPRFERQGIFVGKTIIL